MAKITMRGNNPDEVTNEAIERAGNHANEDWKEAALDAVILVASRMGTFTTDDVWEVLDAGNEDTHERRAMGMVMRKAVSMSLCRATGEYRASRRPECHKNPKRVYESLINVGSISGA